MPDNSNPDEWTFKSLFKHWSDLRDSDLKHASDLRDADQLATATALAAQEKGSAASLAAQKEATNKAEASQNKRDKASNNIRGAMMDDRKNYATTDKVDGLTERLGKVENTQSASAGEQHGQGMSRAAMVTIITLAIALSGLVISFLVLWKK